MKKVTLFLGLLIFAVNYVCSQDITFSHLTTDDGLSQISVNDLYEDERGFIWIGTREGLNCYAENSIITYKHRKNDIYSLFCNNILKIAGDKKGKIYLLCTDGVAEYDIRKDRFNTLLKAVDVGAVCFENRLFIGRGNTVYYFDREKNEFEKYYQLDNNEMNITCLFFDNKGTLWIGTAKNGFFAKNKDDARSQHLFDRGNITSVYQDSKDDIWVGSWNHGLFQISKGQMKVHCHDPKNDNSISTNFARGCCEDNQGNIWIGTFLGLEYYNRSTGNFTHYKASDSPDGLSHSSIWSIIKDQQGTLWMGTYFGGVNYFNPEYKIYTQYKPSETEAEGLSSPIVGKMIEDDKDNLWICTEGGGLNVYNKETKKFKWYKHDASRNSVSENNIKAIYYDTLSNVIWLGTHLGGLNKLDLRTQRFTHYLSNPSDPATIPSDIVKDIFPYNGELIVATENGVVLFDPQTERCRPLFKPSKESSLIKNTADLFIDDKGLLWMAVIGEGVFTYNFETEELKNYFYDPDNEAGLSNNNINSINQDFYGNIWLCTSGSGLDLYRRETDSFQNFDMEKNGLLSDCVYEVRNSPYGKLLVITNQGFARFDYSTQTFTNYNIESGFPLTTINENALHLSKDGEVFLGGVKGMVSFYEKDLDFTKKPYSIVFTKLLVNNKEIKVDDESGILRNSLSSTEEIRLKHGQSVFSIEFATTNFIPANRDEILYKLEGFSNEWVSSRGQRSITYTNLNAGDYKLIIKSNEQDNPYVSQAELKIKVLPPFYNTIYAYILYFIAFVSISYFLIKSYNDRVRLRESLKYEKKHTEDVERMNQSKLRFFTNISHEFRTPLTLINGQMEMLLQMNTFTPNVYNRLLKIYKSSIQLKELVSELLDFRKQEQGHMKIKVNEHNIVDFLNENYLLFLEYANIKNIHLQFKKSSDTLMVWYDQKQMQKVVNNLLSNAFKHTPAEGTIKIDIRQDDEYAILRISDTGTGIAAKDIDKIFDRFYQTESLESFSSTGTGIGLALTKGIVELHRGQIKVTSEVNKGTVFTVRLKLGNAHFTTEELNHSKEEPVANEEFKKREELEVIFEQEALEVSDDKLAKSKKILLVEDNEALLELLVGIFEPYYQTITATNGQEGLEKAKSEMPDIVVSDVLMPQMSGTEMCKLLKADIDTSHIPVVLLTARTAIEHTLEGLRIGADDYITKPFDVNILVSRCNNLINNRIVLQEKFSKQPQTEHQMLATNALDKKMLDKAMRIIEENLDNTGFNMNMFAREMGMARTNLFTKIKAITGQTPNDFISLIRLKKAALLLRNQPDMNITEISDRVGFNSPRYFSKCFKEMYHVTPLNYRNNIMDSEDETAEDGDVD